MFKVLLKEFYCDLKSVWGRIAKREEECQEQPPIDDDLIFKQWHLVPKEERIKSESIWVNGLEVAKVKLEDMKSEFGDWDDCSNLNYCYCSAIGLNIWNNIQVLLMDGYLYLIPETPAIKNSTVMLEKVYNLVSKTTS